MTIIIIILCITAIITFIIFCIVQNDGALPIEPPDYTNMANRDVYLNRDKLYK